MKIRKAASLDKITPEVMKIRKFDDTLPPLCNTVYKQTAIENGHKATSFPSPRKAILKSLKITEV